jgi:histidinol phosphatase-like PHP family hydrolase
MKVVKAAKKGAVAIEINNRYRLPGLRFVQAAKAEGLKFSFGTNNTDANLGRSEYGIEMVKQCGLQWNDFFVPAAVGDRGIDRKGSILKS